MMKHFWLLFLLPALAFAETKKIEGTTNVEDAMCVAAAPENNFGARENFIIRSTTAIYALIRVKNVASELGAGATITGCVCSLYCYTNTADGDYGAYRTFKPWVEGDEDGVDNDDGDVTYIDFQSDALEWTIGISACMNDDGVDNSFDNGSCDAPEKRNHKATAEDTETVNAVGWYAWNISTDLAQGWYDGTINEEGIILIHSGTPDNTFYSTEYTTDPSLCPFFVFTYTTEEPAAAGQVIMINQ